MRIRIPSDSRTTVCKTSRLNVSFESAVSFARADSTASLASDERAFICSAWIASQSEF